MLTHTIIHLGVFLTFLSARAATADFIGLMDKSRFARQSPIEGCRLPVYPPNGRYTVSNYGAKQIVPGDVVSPFTILTYNCEEGFDPTVKFSSCQENNIWSDTPECYQCGLEKALGITLLIRGTNAKKDTFPWHVAIFQDKGGLVPENICAGSLVRADLVISAAHCFYDPRNYISFNASNYKVACGKFYRSWDNANDSMLPHVQRSELRRIILPDAYRGDELYHVNDVSILVLATAFRLSDSVHPVCIDLDSEELYRIQVEPGKTGKVAGWGVTELKQPSEVLRSLALPVVGIPECRMEMIKYRFTRYLTNDKLCAGYTNGSALCLGDSGGGLVFPDFQQTTNTTRWYLRGIVSIAPFNEELDSCRANTYTAFTNIFKLRDWLHNQLRLLTAPAEGCQLPYFPSNGVYIIDNYGAKKVPGDVVSQSTTLAYFCKKDFELTAPVSSCQENNTWSAMPECIARAATTLPKNVTQESPVDGCRLPNFPHDGRYTVSSYGAKRIVPGDIVSELTILTYSCNEGFDLTGQPLSVCEDSYIWSSVPECNPRAATTLPKNATQESPVDGCRLPDFPHDGRYTVSSFGVKKTVPGDIVSELTILTYSCKEGFDLTGQPLSVCEDGYIWSSMPECNPRAATTLPKNVTQESPVGGCRLPDFPYNGRYTVSNFGAKKIVPGDIVSELTILTYSCKEGFDLTGQLLSVCQEGNTWSDVPKCNPRCNMPTSNTVDFKCSLPTGPISCSSTLHNGSTIFSTCKEGHFTLEDLPVLTCRNRSWDYTTPKCSPGVGGG